MNPQHIAQPFIPDSVQQQIQILQQESRTLQREVESLNIQNRALDRKIDSLLSIEPADVIASLPRDTLKMLVDSFQKVADASGQGSSGAINVLGLLASILIALAALYNAYLAQQSQIRQKNELNQKYKKEKIELTLNAIRKINMQIRRAMRLLKDEIQIIGKAESDSNSYDSENVKEIIEILARSEDEFAFYAELEPVFIQFSRFKRELESTVRFNFGLSRVNELNHLLERYDAKLLKPPPNPDEESGIIASLYTNYRQAHEQLLFEEKNYRKDLTPLAKTVFDSLDEKTASAKPSSK